MKKVVRILLAAVLTVTLLFSFAACGEKDPSAAAGGDPSKITGETFDAGNITALCPDGWKAFPVSDTFDEYEGDNDPNAVSLYKGAESEWDMFSTPGIQINYYGPESGMTAPYKDFYDNVVDLEDMTIGDCTWHGFSGESLETPLTMLWTEDGGALTQVTVWTEMDGKTISLEDADVQAILMSIQVK